MQKQLEGFERVDKVEDDSFEMSLENSNLVEKELKEQKEDREQRRFEDVYR